MPDPHAKPGPRDGSGILVATLAGIIVGILLFLLKYWLSPSAGGYGIVPFLLVGAAVGAGAGMLRRRMARPGSQDESRRG